MSEESKWVIKVVADQNDADYTTQEATVTDDSELLSLVHKVVGLLKKKDDNWNWPVGDIVRYDLGEQDAYQMYVESGQLTEDEFERFNEEFVITDIHTIELITIRPYAGEETLFSNWS